MPKARKKNINISYEKNLYDTLIKVANSRNTDVLKEIVINALQRGVLKKIKDELFEEKNFSVHFKIIEVERQNTELVTHYNKLVPEPQLSGKDTDTDITDSE